MARYIEEGKSIFIPFWKGYSITDSQLHLRMYKTVEMFNRHFPNKTNYDVLCEYAPVVRCKYCAYYQETIGKDSGKPCGYGICINTCAIITGIVYDEDFCSYGERKDNGQ